VSSLFSKFETLGIGDPGPPPAVVGASRTKLFKNEKTKKRSKTSRNRPATQRDWFVFISELFLNGRMSKKYAPVAPEAGQVFFYSVVLLTWRAV